MKKILFTLLTIMLLVSSVNAQSRKRVIDPDNLPKPAIQLIQQHWPSCAIDFAYVNGKVIDNDDAVMALIASDLSKMEDASNSMAAQLQSLGEALELDNN